MNWTPITIEKIYSLILDTEKELHGDLLTFWESIKIQPEKWSEDTCGEEGGGFWAVGLVGKKVIYYNDIEDGFNVSDFENHGTIDEYVCNQDKLILTIKELFDLGKPDRQIKSEDNFPIENNDFRQLYAAARYLSSSIKWEKDWIHFGTENEVKNDLVDRFISDFFTDDTLALICDRKNSALYPRDKILAIILGLLGRESFQLWNESLTKVIDFNRIGVLRTGKHS